MQDKVLLDSAEALLQSIDKDTPMDMVQANSLQSIAASLLVIARNSGPIENYQEVEPSMIPGVTVSTCSEHGFAKPCHVCAGVER
jgi:hypothetical protein